MAFHTRSRISRMLPRLAAVCLALALYGPRALAQDASGGQQMPAAVIGVINLEKVERSSIAWESLRKQINDRRALLQKEVEKLQQELQRKAQEIESQRALLTPEALAAKAREFQSERADLQEQTNLRKQRLDAAYGAARGQIRTALNEVLVGLAKERGLNMILVAGEEASSVYFARNELFVDDVALARLNKAITAVTLPEDAPAAGAAGQ